MDLDISYEELERRHTLPKSHTDYIMHGGLVEGLILDYQASVKLLEANKDRITYLLAVHDSVTPNAFITYILKGRSYEEIKDIVVSKDENRDLASHVAYYCRLQKLITP